VDLLYNLFLELSWQDFDWNSASRGSSAVAELVVRAVEVPVVDATDHLTSAYAAIGNGRVHYSTTSALSPTTLLSSARQSARRSQDVAAYTPDSLPPFYDRRDLLATTHNRRSVVPDGDSFTTTPIELPRSRLRFIHVLGRGLFGDVSGAV